MNHAAETIGKSQNASSESLPRSFVDVYPVMLVMDTDVLRPFTSYNQSWESATDLGTEMSHHWFDLRGRVSYVQSCCYPEYEARNTPYRPDTSF